MIAAFSAWFNQTIAVSTMTGMDRFGSPAFGTPISTRCYIEAKPTKVVSAAGEEVVSSAKIYLPGNANLTCKTRLILPDGTAPILLKVEQIVNESGILELTVVYT